MKAIVSVSPLAASDPAVFEERQLPDPVPAGHDLLVQVHAVSVNPIDTKIRMVARQPDSPPKVLGWDAAGIVLAVGPQVTGFSPGERVWYAGNVQRAGSNAQLQLVDARITGRMPDSLNFAQAAALPLTALTAYEGLFEHLYVGATIFGFPDSHRDPADQNLLVVGGAGGVGSISIQLARQVPGLTVVATASREQSRAWCRQMGAHHVVDHRADLIAQSEQAGIKRFDFVFLTRDPDGYFETAARLAGPHGKICSIVDAAKPLPVMKLRNKGGGFSWEAMFARSNLQAHDIARQGDILSLVARWVDEGKLVSTMTENFGPMTATNLQRAHQAVQAGSMVGKAVLTWVED